MEKKLKIFSFIFLTIFFIGGMLSSSLQYVGVFPLLISAIYLIIKKRKQVIDKNFWIYLTIFLLISFSFYLGYSKVIDKTDFIKEAQKYWGSFLLFIVAYIFIKSKHISLKKIQKLFIIGIILTSIKGLVQLCLIAFKTNTVERLNTPLGMSNNYASILIIGILILFYNIYNNEYLTTKYGDISILAFFLVNLYLTESLGAIISFGMAILIFLFFKRRKVNFANVIVFVLLISLIAGTILFLFTERVMDYNNRRRCGLLRGYYNLSRDNIITGVGLNQTELHYDEWKTPLPFQNEFEYAPNYDAHNFILQWIAENGIVSFIILAFFLIYYYINNFKKFSPHYGILLGTIAFLIHALFSNNFHIIRLMMYFWFFMGSYEAYKSKLKRSNYGKK